MANISLILEDVDDPYDYQTLCYSLRTKCKEIKEYGDELEKEMGRQLDSIDIVESFPEEFYMTIDADELAKSVKIY